MEIDKKIIKKLIEVLEDLKKSINDKEIVNVNNAVEEEIDDAAIADPDKISKKKNQYRPQ